MIQMKMSVKPNRRHHLVVNLATNKKVTMEDGGSQKVGDDKDARTHSYTKIIYLGREKIHFF